MVDMDMAKSLVVAKQQLRRSQTITYIIAAVAVLLALVFAYLIVRSLIRRTNRLTLRAQRLAIGDLQSNQSLLSNYVTIDELSPVEEALDLIEVANRQMIEITNAMAVGNILSRLTPRSDDDQLVAAINQMADSSADVVGIVNTMAVGDLTSRLTPRSGADALAEAINQMADNSAQVAMIANTIASGDLTKEVAVRSDEDQLSLALREMVINLRNTTKAKDQFLSSMSHELRTPLNAIIGLSSALISENTKISHKQQTKYLTAISSSGEHLLDLIGDILDLSKLNSNARELEKRPFTILEVMELSRKTFNLVCQNKGVNLIIDNQLKGPYPVLGDVTVLNQILFNLLSNAVRFTAQGTISLTAMHHADSEFDSSPGVVFVVTDTGKGIKADAISQLFNPFTQEDSSIARSYGGSGLGLNIAQKLAQLMGGEIKCTSTVGHGSKFEVVIHLEPQCLNFEMPMVSSIQLPPLKLLVVDDVELNIMVATALLTPHGHTVETAESGYQAIEMASNNDYSAILMDVHMPGMSGIEATKTIRNIANKERASVPIVALSADVDIKQQTLFIAEGMNAFVGKPWRVEDLEKELKSLLNLG